MCDSEEHPRNTRGTPGRDAVPLHDIRNAWTLYQEDIREHPDVMPGRYPGTRGRDAVPLHDIRNTWTLSGTPGRDTVPDVLNDNNDMCQGTEEAQIIFFC